MRGLIAVAGQRGLSAGTLMIAAGGLVLYQMTSLVLGPAGSRDLHLSLAIPTVDADELSDPVRSGVNEVLGMAVAATPAPSARSSGQALRRAAQPQPTAPPAAAPIIATPPALPLPAEPPAKHGQGHPQPPRHHYSD